MEFSKVLEALGGGPGAVMICGLGWFVLRLLKRNDDLTALLMARKDDELRAAIEREITVQNILKSISAAIGGGA